MEEPPPGPKKDAPTADDVNDDSQDYTRDGTPEEEGPAGVGAAKPSPAPSGMGGAPTQEDGADTARDTIQLQDAQIITTAPARGRVAQVQPPVCQVPGCGKDLSGCRGYHQRYKICEEHIRVHSMVRNGQVVRFCQQCGKFQPIEDFHQDRRSCSIQLALHAGRRRKRHALAKAQKPGGTLPHSSGNPSSDNEGSGTHEGRKRSRSDDAQTSGLNMLTEEEVRMLRVIIQKAGTDVVKGLASLEQGPARDSKSTTASPNIDLQGHANVSSLTTKEELPQQVLLSGMQHSVAPAMTHGGGGQLMSLPVNLGGGQSGPSGGVSSAGQLPQFATLDMATALQWGSFPAVNTLGQLAATQQPQSQAQQLQAQQQAHAQQQAQQQQQQPFLLMMGPGMSMSAAQGSAQTMSQASASTAALSAAGMMPGYFTSGGVMHVQAGNQILALQTAPQGMGQPGTSVLVTMDPQQQAQHVQGAAQQQQQQLALTQMLQGAAANGSLPQSAFTSSNMMHVVPWGMQYAPAQAGYTYEAAPAAQQPPAPAASQMIASQAAGQQEPRPAASGPSTAPGPEAFALAQQPARQQVLQQEQAGLQQQQQQQVVLAGGSAGLQMAVPMNSGGVFAGDMQQQQQQIMFLPQAQFNMAAPSNTAGQQQAWPGALTTHGMAGLPPGMTVLSQADLAALLQQHNNNSLQQ